MYCCLCNIYDTIVMRIIYCIHICHMFQITTNAPELAYPQYSFAVFCLSLALPASSGLIAARCGTYQRVHKLWRGPAVDRCNGARQEQLTSCSLKDSRVLQKGVFWTSLPTQGRLSTETLDVCLRYESLTSRATGNGLREGGRPLLISDHRVST